MKLALDINRYSGRIKPLHGVNNCPIRFGEEKIPEFESAGIPFVRTHDSGGPYGRGTLIDIPNIFRDFDADPDDPASYDFAFTDIYLRNLVNSGCKIFYRLGITIKNFYAIKAYRTAPPKDFKKWARICEGVIRHYNHGWAGDFTTVSNTGKSGTNQKTRRCGQARWKNISNSIPLPRNI